MSDDGRLDAALDLMRRVAPRNAASNLRDLVTLAPDLADDLLQTVDQPLKTAQCPSTGLPFLLCDYNRDGDAFRSPHASVYYSPETQGASDASDHVFPPSSLLALEKEANETWRAYVRAYHDASAVGSVYVWELPEEPYESTGAFGACFLTKRTVDGERGVTSAVWDAIHVVGAHAASGGNGGSSQSSSSSYQYSLTSTIMLALQTGRSAQTGLEVDVSGAVTRQRNATLALKHGASARSHIANIGSMIQDEELRLRTQMEDVYFGKTAEIVGTIHSRTSADERGQRGKVASELSAALVNRHK
jgi:capping protein beta